MYYDIKSALKLILKYAFKIPLQLVPEGKYKFLIRAGIAKLSYSIPVEFLANPGETVVLVGFHRIDSVMRWSYMVGKDGRVIVIEAVPEYVENIRVNLDFHLGWPLKNIVYVAKGVDAVPGKKTIQIGNYPDYNKLADQSINDGLNESDFIRQLDIEIDTIDSILDEHGIENINHVTMTISGMELEALKGMRNTLLSNGLRLQIRSLHMKNGELLYPQVVKILKACGMKTVLGKRIKKFNGRDIYACRI